GGERRPKQVAVGVADTVALVAETPAVIVDEPGAVAADDLDGLPPVGSVEGVGPGVSDGERVIAGGVLAGSGRGRRCLRTGLACAKNERDQREFSHGRARLRCESRAASSFFLRTRSS